MWYKNSYCIIILLLAISSAVARPEQASPPRQRSSVRLKVAGLTSAPLRAAFGQASHVVEATLINAQVYDWGGEVLAELPDELGKRQQLVLTLHLRQTLCSNTGQLPPEIRVYLESAGLPVARFLYPLTIGPAFYLLKRAYNQPARVVYYPVSSRKWTAEVAYRSTLVEWARARVQHTPAEPAHLTAYYRVPGRTPRVLQEADADCWAAAAAMMLSWRDQRPYTRQEAAALGGAEFSNLLATPSIAGGILPAAKATFLNRLGLTAEAPQTFTVQGIRELLLEHGPLWVTSTLKEMDNPDFLQPHARVVIAIDGDGSPDQTYLTFLDPNINSNLHRQNLRDFTREYEKVATADLQDAAPGSSQPFRPQILHF